VKKTESVDKPLPRLDRIDRVATHIVDVSPPGVLHAELFAALSHVAKIRRLDLSRAQTLKGGCML
jgi:hypothetical protein